MVIPKLIRLDQDFETTLGVPIGAARQLARSVDDFYRQREIETRGKTRTLSVPFGELKRLQTLLHRRIFQPARWPACMYCCKGRGAIRAASAHVKHPMLLQLDLRSFFPSVRPARVRTALREAGASEEVAWLIGRLVTYQHELPQGAPTSVAVGNLVLSPVDRRLAVLARKQGLTYTRYVDDLLFSGGARLTRHRNTIDRILDECRWTVGRQSCCEVDEQHRVLGIITNAKLNADPRFLHDLRAELRRLATNGILLPDAPLRSLAGKVAWVKALNPARGRTLEALFAQVRSSSHV